MTGAVGAIVGLVLLGADIALRYTRKRRLRKPTKEQIRDFAEPVGRMLARHVDMSIFGPDLLDLAEAGNATAQYIDGGPLTDRIMPAVSQMGMEQEPSNVDDEPTSRIYAGNEPIESDWVGNNPIVTELP